MAPTSGTTPATLGVSVNSAGLAPGTYTSAITITAAGASNTPFAVPVTFTVTAQAGIVATPGTLSFSYAIGATTPAVKSVAISTSNGAAATFSAVASTTSGGKWLAVSPATGSTPASLAISVNPASLAVGTYIGSVAISAPGFTSQTVSVTLTVTPASQASIVITGTSSFTVYNTTVPYTTTLGISVSTNAALPYTVAAVGALPAWLTFTPTSGTTPGNLTLTAKAAGLYPGNANVFLDRVNADYFLGGAMLLHPDESARAVGTLAAELAMEPETLQQAGILSVVNAQMAGLMRQITIGRGLDPREFALIAYGGAGPMHAVFLAEELDIRTVLVPYSPGTFSAQGMLAADVSHDIVRPFFVRWDRLDPAAADALLSEMKADGGALLAERDPEAGHPLPVQRRPALRRTRALTDAAVQQGRCRAAAPVPPELPPHLRARQPGRDGGDGEPAGDRHRAEPAPGPGRGGARRRG